MRMKLFTNGQVFESASFADSKAASIEKRIKDAIDKKESVVFEMVGGAVTLQPAAVASMAIQWIK